MSKIKKVCVRVRVCVCMCARMAVSVPEVEVIGGVTDEHEG